MRFWIFLLLSAITSPFAFSQSVGEEDFQTLMAAGEKDYFAQQYTSSARNYAKAADHGKKKYGPASAQYLNATWSLVWVHQQLNDPAQVDSKLDEVVKLVAGIFPNDTTHIDLVERSADFLRKANHLPQAHKHYKTAIRTRKKFLLTKGTSYYWDLVYTRDYLYSQKKYDSVHLFFEEILTSLPPTADSYASALKEWANFCITSKSLSKTDVVEKKCNEYLQIKEQRNEKDNWYAEIWITFGRLYNQRGQTERALNCFAQARKAIAPIIDKSFNQNLYCLSYIVQTYNTSKKYDEHAGNIVKEFESENDKIADKDPGTYVDNLADINRYYVIRKRLNEAERTLEKTLVATQKLYGNNSEEYSMVMVVYRQVLEESGNKEKLKNLPSATAADEQALIKALDLEKGSDELQQLNRYMRDGDYLSAVNFFEKRSQLIINYYTINEQYEPLIQTLQVISNCYREVGNFRKSFELLTMGEQMALEKLPASNMTQAVAVHYVANFLKLSGSYQEAEERYLRSLNLLDAARTDANKQENDRNYYGILGQLADLYMRMRYYRDAEDLFFKALSYYKTQYGAKSNEAVMATFDLANLYRAWEEYALAEYYLREIDSDIRKLYRNTAEYYNYISSVAALYNQRGKYADAEPLYLQTKDYFLKTRGNKSQSYIGQCRDLAVMYHHQGQFAKASELYQEINSLLLYQTDNFFPSLSERERNAFYRSTYQAFDSYNAFAIKSVAADPAEGNRMFDLQMVSKGMLFKAYNKMRDNISASNNDSLKVMYERWIETRNRLAKIYQMSDAEKKNAGIDERKMEASAEALEKKLSQQSELFGKIISKRPTWQDIQQKLKPGEAAVEMVRIWTSYPAYKFEYVGKGITFDTTGTDGFADVFEIKSEKTAAYKAGVREGDLILKINGVTTKGKSKNQIHEMLSAPIAELTLRQYTTKKEMSVRLKADSVFSRYYDRKAKYAALIITPGNSTNVDVVVLEDGDQLESRYLTYYRNMIRTKSTDQYSYDVYWKKIREKTRGARKIFFSPDGVYNAVNINTFYNTETGKYVIDETEIVQVGSTSDVLLTKDASTGRGAVLVGFPDYYKKDFKTLPAPQRDSSYYMLALDSTQRFMDGTTIADLPGTRGEVNTIADIMSAMKLDAKKLTEGEASEENIKNVRSPKVLHIATHGFFVKELGQTTGKDGRSFTGMLNEKMKENPLLRSGLLLAGSGKTISGEKDPNTEDGILTAYEAMNLQLDQTELVVMSACETGLGQMQSGEGVYGLQRAFRAAGAQSVMMSMWKVDDLATQQLMSEFYRQWLKEGDKQPSFRNAQLRLRQQFTHPYYWGAFILVGN